MNAANQITTADLKIVRQWVRSSDKAGALLDTANLQQFREKLWAALQDGLDVKTSARLFPACSTCAE